MLDRLCQQPFGLSTVYTRYCTQGDLPFPYTAITFLFVIATDLIKEAYRGKKRQVTHSSALCLTRPTVGLAEGMRFFASVDLHQKGAL